MLISNVYKCIFADAPGAVDGWVLGAVAGGVVTGNGSVCGVDPPEADAGAAHGALVVPDEVPDFTELRHGDAHAHGLRPQLVTHLRVLLSAVTGQLTHRVVTCK